MELLFLGTSSGTPTRSRNLSALALRSLQSGQWCLVDCGEATQHQILHTSLSLMTLRAICITHIHGDHCYGLPGLLASAGMLNRSEVLTIAGPPEVAQFVRCVMASTRLVLPYPIEFIDVHGTGSVDLGVDFDVHASALSHRVPSFAYTFSERTVERKLDVEKLKADGIPAGPAWGRIQQGFDVVIPGGRVIAARDYVLAPRKPRKIIVGGDNDTPALLAAEAHGADVLVHEATYTEEVLARIGPGPQHSSARRVAAFAQGAGIPNLVLTHFSPRYQQQDGALSMAQLEAEARSVYSGNLFLANDLERYSLDKHGCLARAGQ